MATAFPPLKEFIAYDEEGLREFIATHLNNQRVADILADEGMTGEFLLMMEEKEMELLTRLGDKMLVKKILQHYKQPASTSTCSSDTSSSRDAIPDSSSPHSVGAWVHTYKPPLVYSDTTQNYLDGQNPSGHASAKSEIIRAVYCQVLQLERRPTPAEYIAVAKKVVEMFPVLKDKGTSEPWATIKRSLILKFRNMRRPKRSTSDGDVSVDERPPKKMKKQLQFTDILAQEEQKEMIVELKKLWMKKKKGVPRVKELMDSLFDGRREFIIYKQPSIEEVMESFPALASPKILLREFNKIVGRRMLLEDWEVWEKRILQYGKVKFGEKADEALQAKIEEAEDKDDERAYQALVLLTKILVPRVKKDIPRLVEAKRSDCDLNLITSECISPYILRLEGDAFIQYHILMENLVLLETSTIKEALLLLFAAYFAFDIKYPKFISPLYEFMQNYIFNYKTQKRETMSVSQTCALLLSIDNTNTLDNTDK